MKVYSAPVDFKHDYRNDTATETARVEAHTEELRKWLTNNGYRGKNSGKVISFHVADGSAQYMLAEGAKSMLIHLPYWDAYQYRDVSFLPKKEILARVAQAEKWEKMFAERRKVA